MQLLHSPGLDSRLLHPAAPAPALPLALADIGQFHTWLLSKRPDGQPIYLLTLLPGYPLLNFALVTAVYVTLSHRLFQTTSTLKDAVVPHDDNRLLLRNCLMMVVIGGVAACFGFLMVEARAMLMP